MYRPWLLVSVRIRQHGTHRHDAVLIFLKSQLQPLLQPQFRSGSGTDAEIRFRRFVVRVDAEAGDELDLAARLWTWRSAAGEPGSAVVAVRGTLSSGIAATKSLAKSTRDHMRSWVLIPPGAAGLFSYFPSPVKVPQGGAFLKVCCESNNKMDA